MKADVSNVCTNEYGHDAPAKLYLLEQALGWIGSVGHVVGGSQPKAHLEANGAEKKAQLGERGQKAL